MKQNEITHVVLVLDASPSMYEFEKDCNKVAQNLITHLAQNKVDGEEIRITVYSFWESAQCLMYDMDVLRAVGEFRDRYHCGGRSTALKDATVKALDELAETPERYGEHLFLVYVLTDGMDNASRTASSAVKSRIANLPDHWAVAVFMPGEKCKKFAVEYGFAEANVDVWDATTKQGFVDVGAKIKTATDNVMTYRRSTGSRQVKGKSILSMNLKDLSVADIKKNLQPLTAGYDYDFLNVTSLEGGAQINHFVNARLGRPYRIGEAFYQLVEKEDIQPSKEVVVQVNATGVVYRGRFDQVRKMLGLPDEHVKVYPDQHPEYTLFIQSKSVNRKLDPNTRLMIMKR